MENNNRLQFFAIPLVLGLIGLVGLLLLAPSGVTTWGLAFFLLLLSVAGGLWLWRQASDLLQQTEMLRNELTGTNNQLDLTRNQVLDTEDLGTRITPIWKRHIETSSSQMEESILALTERFSSLVVELQQVSSNTHIGTGEESIAHSIERDRGGMSGRLQSRPICWP